MNWVAELVLAIMLPTAAGFAIVGLVSGSRWLAEARRKDPLPDSIERLETSLRRLRAELEETETRSGLTAKNHRIQVLRGAYLDALGSACQRLDVSPPQGGDGAPLAEIYRAEDALRQRGLDVRATAAR